SLIDRDLSPFQFRALIVQGAYERLGFSQLERQTRRAAAQVEVDAGNYARTLERSLRSDGGLSLQRALEKRLFAYHWALNGNPRLIEQIRQRAIILAERDPTFWGLRVEIHNFPTADVLLRTRAHGQRLALDSETGRQISTLIAEMERFLNTAGNELPSSPKALEVFTSHPLSFGRPEPSRLLQELAESRQMWLSEAGSRTEYYREDRWFSDYALRLGNKVVESAAATPREVSASEANDLSLLILEQVVLDDELSSQALQTLKRDCQEILADSALDEERKRELILQLHRSALDREVHAFYQDYSPFDRHFQKLAKRSSQTRSVPRFVDEHLRSGNTAMASRLLDTIENKWNLGNNKIQISGRHFAGHSSVYNHGEVNGVVRVGKNPMTLTEGEIGVFENTPTEAAPMAGIITVGSGARLSHLQLLARSLGIPNVRVPLDLLPELRKLEGQTVRFSATRDGKISLAAGAVSPRLHPKRAPIQLPKTNGAYSRPLSADEAARIADDGIAGSKGMNLARLRNESALRASIPDFVLLPYGFYQRYLQRSELLPQLEALTRVDLENKELISLLAARIRRDF
ncbi:MAG: hypothetical protein AAB425_05795, partial [Bdellovibrionota bacterium]